MSGPAQDADLSEAVGGARPPTDTKPGQTGGPINKSHELAGDEQRGEILGEVLMEGRPEATPPTPPTPPRNPPDNESEKSDS
jgi:hypothetical protein